jgi:hypothetical protein
MEIARMKTIPNSPTALLNPKQVASILNLDAKTVREAMESGSIPSVRVNSRIYSARGILERWMQGQEKVSA